MPNTLLPTTERPHPVSSAACASKILGDTPSCRPASCSSGLSCSAKDWICVGDVPLDKGVSAFTTLGVPAIVTFGVQPEVGDRSPPEIIAPALPCGSTRVRAPLEPGG